jgi:hypothetical protein
MAKYLQRFCPKCNNYLGIVVPEAGDQWAVFEMWISADVGLWFQVNAALSNLFSCLSFDLSCLYDV